MKRSFLYIFLGSLAICYIYFSNKYSNARWMNNYEKFNKSNINNAIIKSGIIAKGSGVYFENDTIVFYPKTSEMNNNSIFLSTAKKGDSIIKKPHEDTLILKKKKGTIFKYTFRKFP